MRITTFASGSSGNCALISGGSSHILLDAGISCKRIKQGLAAQGLLPDDINGVLITHEHSDHISGLKILIKYHDVTVFAPRTIANHLRMKLPEIDDHIREIKCMECINIDGLHVFAFDTPHDTPQSVGYRFEYGGEALGFSTDMGHVSPSILEGLKGCETVFIESNHDLDMLMHGSYPVYLKRRILSDHGHLSNSDCGDLAIKLVGEGARTVILGHLSRENNMPELAYKTVSESLSSEGMDLHSGDGIRVMVAPAAEILHCETGSLKLA